MPVARQLRRQIVEARLGDDERGAAPDSHHAERGDERGQPDADDEPGRHQAGGDADEQARARARP